MGQRPTTSLRILDAMKNGSPVSTRELSEITLLGRQTLDPNLYAMLRKGLIFRHARGCWRINQKGIEYLKKWAERTAMDDEMVREYISGKTMEQIAKEFPVSSETVRRLLLKRCPGVIRGRGIKRKDPRARTAILSFKQEQEVIKLYNDGNSAREIGRTLGVSRCTVLKVLHHYVPDRIRPPIHPATKIKPQPVKLTTQKAFLIGHLIGDGSVMRNSYTIRYSNTCLKLILEVSKAFAFVYGIEGRISVRNGTFYVDWDSKNAWADLRQYTNYHCGEWRVPNQVFKEPDVLGPPFLRALFDDDGNVALCSSQKHKSWQRWVCLRSTSARGCEDVIRLLSLLGIQSRRANKAVIISGRKNIERFRSVINFTEGVKVRRGLWKGFDKRKVLELLLASYENPSLPRMIIGSSNINAESSLSSPPVA